MAQLDIVRRVSRTAVGNLRVDGTDGVDLRMNLRLVVPCIIAGCVRNGLYGITRPIGNDQTTVMVCRKCAADLVTAYGWKLKGRR